MSVTNPFDIGTAGDSIPCWSCGGGYGTHCPGCAAMTGIKWWPPLPTIVLSPAEPLSPRISWECSRCRKINAPHVDQCPCDPS